MTTKPVGTILGLPVSTWVAIGMFCIAILSGGAKFYASDEVQTSKIEAIEVRVVKIENNSQLLYDIRERLARIEAKMEQDGRP